MSESILFCAPEPGGELPAVFVEGRHRPDPLASASGEYISCAGSAFLQKSVQKLQPNQHWLWLCVENGNTVLFAAGQTFAMKSGECTILPPMTEGMVLETEQECRILWLMVGGALSDEFMQRLGGISHRVMRQGVLPSQITLARHIVQSVVRMQDAQNTSSAQLQQLLWGLLASHNGQPVAMDAVLSHEISKVVDAMRRNQYKDNYSLSEMAALSRMPV